MLKVLQTLGHRKSEYQQSPHVAKAHVIEEVPLARLITRVAGIDLV